MTQTCTDLARPSTSTQHQQRVCFSFQCYRWALIPVVGRLRGRRVPHQSGQAEHVVVGGPTLPKKVGHRVAELVRGDGDANQALRGPGDEVGDVGVGAELGVLGLLEGREQQVRRGRRPHGRRGGCARVATGQRGEELGAVLVDPRRQGALPDVPLEQEERRLAVLEVEPFDVDGVRLLARQPLEPGEARLLEDLGADGN